MARERKNAMGIEVGEKLGGNVGSLMAVLPRLLLAVEILATGGGEAKERVKGAFEAIRFLKSEEFPAHYRNQFDMIVGSPPEPGNKYSRDWWDSKFYRMRQKAAIEIAKRIHALCGAIRREDELNSRRAVIAVATREK